MKLLAAALLVLSALASSGCSLLIRRCSEDRDICPGAMVCDLGSGRCVPGPDADADLDADADADLDADLDADGGADGDADADGDGDGDADQDGDGGPGCSVDLDADVDVESECLPASCLCFVRVDAGTFTMGSDELEAGRLEAYWPETDVPETAHEVTLSRDFLILSTEVTREDFLAVAGFDPFTFPPGSPTGYCGVGDHCAVESVTWHQAAWFCNLLSGSDYDSCYECTGDAEGGSLVCDAGVTPIYDCEGYRLPTEAEWEYAARGGIDCATYAGDLDGCDFGVDSPACAVLESIAWWAGSDPVPEASSVALHPVGQKPPNAYGLFDVLGNAQEWVHDGGEWLADYAPEPVVDPVSEGDAHRVRGCDYSSTASACRAAARGWSSPGEARVYRGFRVVRSIIE